MPGDVRDLLGGAKTFVESPDLQELPKRIDDVAAQIEDFLQEANQRDLAGNLSDAIAALTKTANGIDTAVQGLPELISNFDNLAQKAGQMKLNELSTQLTGLLESADQLISTPGARELPKQLGEALDRVRAVLAELQEGGVVDNVNATLASARQAADQVAAAANELPALLSDAQTVLNQASVTLQGYDASSGIGRQVNQTLREVDRAAAAIAALARELERNPNALIFGR